jgi:hypothetical protein
MEEQLIAEAREMVPRRRTDALRVDVGVQACLSGASFQHHFWEETQGSQTFSTAKGEGEPTWQDLDGPHESGRCLGRRISGVVGDRSGRICVRSS